MKIIFRRCANPVTTARLQRKVVGEIRTKSIPTDEAVDNHVDNLVDNPVDNYTAGGRGVYISTVFCPSTGGGVACEFSHFPIARVGKFAKWCDVCNQIFL